MATQPERFKAMQVQYHAGDKKTHDEICDDDLWAGRFSRHSTPTREEHVKGRSERRRRLIDRTHSRRERQVVAYAAVGHANKLIVKRVPLRFTPRSAKPRGAPTSSGHSLPAVANHLAETTSKLGVRSRTEPIHVVGALRVSR